MQRSTRLAIGVLFLFALMFAFVVVGLLRLSRHGAPTQDPTNALLVVQLSGAFTDMPLEDDFASAFLEEGTSSVEQVRQALTRAATDRHIRGVLLQVSGLSVGWGKAQELRQALKTFKESGKPITAFMEAGEDKDYYVASIADKLYLAPEGMLLLNGLSMEAQFVHETLEKLGIEADYHHRGEYKSAVEMFTRDTMSDAAREATTAILDDLYARFVGDIAEGRSLTPAEVEAYIDDFSISGSRLVEARMVDALLYEDQVLTSLVEAGEETPEVIELGDYLKSEGSGIAGSGDKVAVLYIAGEIHSGESGQGGMFGGTSVGSDTIKRAAQDIREDDSIKAVIVRIDSPGGSSLAADVMWRELVRLGEKKPVIVSMSDLAASGGYWIATAGDAIVAQPGTITGSIGVFMGKLNLRGLSDKVGFKVETISRGRYAQIFSPFKKFDDQELVKVEAMLTETYDNFLDRVAKARNMSVADVDAVARGRIWTGTQALERKLVDKVGGMPEAIALVREHAALSATSEIELVSYPRADDVFSRLLSRFGLRAAVASQIEVREELRPFVELLTGPERAADAGPQAIMPFQLEIH